ncbi:MAG: zinc ribbon domain-containing protein [Lachnospiraceae bacterium]|nr:zinc ribbon domain-containing protein [Lachnospiraceae bacterium]
MGLFDVNENNYSSRQAATPVVDPFENEAREIKAKRSRTIMALGNRIYDENKDKDMSETPYGELYADIAQADKDLILVEKRKQASMGLRTCEKCGAKLPINSGFCNICGSPQGELEPEVIRESHVCPKCGSPLLEGDMFCTGCGYKL